MTGRAANDKDIELTATFDSVATADSFATAHTAESADSRKAGSTEKLSPSPAPPGAPSEREGERGELDAAYHSEEPVTRDEKSAPPDLGVGDGGAAEAQLARTVTGGSARPYSAFPKRTKWLIAGLGGVAAVFSPISVSVIFAFSSRRRSYRTCFKHGWSTHGGQGLTGRATSSCRRSRRWRPRSTARSRTSRSR